MVSNAIITGIINLGLFWLLVALRRLVHRERLCSFLLHGDASGRRLFLKGATLGLLSFAAYPIIVVLFGQGQFGTNVDGLLATIASTIAWGVGFLPVALFEEALFRGYLLQKLSVRSPQWVAVVLPSLLFGALHAGSYGSSSNVWLGLLNAFFFGVALSLVVIRSESLMWAVGFHWAWNIAQEVLLSQPSAEVNGLFNLRVREGLWTGAHLCPETGLIETVIVVLLGASIVLWFGQTNPAAGPRVRIGVQASTDEKRTLG